MARPEKVRLGEVLLTQNLITPIQLETALTNKGNSSRRLGKILVDLGFVTEEQISKALAQQLKIEYIDLKNYNTTHKNVLKLTESQSRRFRSVVLEETETNFIIGMSDPSDLNIYDEILGILKKDLILKCVTEEGVLFIVDKYYRNKEDIQVIAQELEQDIIDVLGVNLQDLTVEDAPVIKLLKGVFEDAVRSNASDIHIEPQKDHTMIRFRIDGVLVLHTKVNSKICAPLISRLKIISNLDIAEKRIPQDGRFHIDVKEKSFDVRISILPENHGEAAVMRLLNQNSDILHINKIGMPEEILEVYDRLIHSNEGMVLVVGPTGSGKTTTLYASLSTVRDVEKKIITIEDPIEYQLGMINQVAVNDKVDLTFEKVLRSVLRQDPDIIMIGEIRDEQTAQIALRSAITGHLIFSTLHTKDTISTPARLIDIGVPSYMVATALQGVLSQRLIRLNCENCKEDEVPNKKELLWAQQKFGEDANYIRYKHSRGCNVCNNSGFFSRTGVYELLEVDEELAALLYKNDLHSFNELAKEKIKGKSMLDSLKKLLQDGKVKLSEVQKMGF